MRTLILAAAAAALGAAMPAPAEDAKKQEPKTMQDVHDFIKKCGHYFIATVEGDQPRVRPFGTVAVFEGKLYIQTGKKKNVAKQLAANPKFEICAFDQAEGVWLRLAATAVPDERIEAKRHMLDLYPQLKKMYAAEDANTLVLYLKDATATFASPKGGDPEVVRF
jgi:uncharacterized pyridoxamine 5'-phosphate oxidase family protein